MNSVLPDRTEEGDIPAVEFKPRIIPSRSAGLRQFLIPRGAIGISAGCYAGWGYGFAIGLGTLCPLRRDVALVIPSMTPFAHQGRLFGSFCGLTVGLGFGPGIVSGFGYSWTISGGRRLSKRLVLVGRALMRLSPKGIVEGLRRNVERIRKFALRFGGGTLPKSVFEKGLRRLRMEASCDLQYFWSSNMRNCRGIRTQKW